MTDPIADMLTRIRNAHQARKVKVEMPSSRMRVGIARILKKEAFIKDYKIVESDKKPMLTVHLRYGPQKKKIITGLKKVSRPGLRVYKKKENIPHVLRGLGIAILSTPQGILTDEEARQANVGGEILCYIW